MMNLSVYPPMSMGSVLLVTAMVFSNFLLQMNWMLRSAWFVATMVASGEGATVVRLSVVEDDVVDLLALLEDGLDSLLELGEVSLLDGLEEDVGLGALEEEAVVCCSEGRVHDDVERAQLGVECADPEEVLLDVQCLCHVQNKQETLKDVRRKKTTKKHTVSVQNNTCGQNT